MGEKADLFLESSSTTSHRHSVSSGFTLFWPVVKAKESGSPQEIGVDLVGSVSPELSSCS
jgi:hypothetical protein